MQMGISNGLRIAVICFFLSLAAIPSCCGETTTENASQSGKESLTFNALNLKVIPFSFADYPGKSMYLIGEPTLSQFVKSIANISIQAQRPKLFEDARLTLLFSGLGFGFWNGTIPIKRLGFKSRAVPLSSATRINQESFADEQYRSYFEPRPVNFPFNEISTGSKESSGGVTVIWNP
jgi:hypothetical protein